MDDEEKQAKWPTIVHRLEDRISKLREKFKKVRERGVHAVNNTITQQ